MPRNGVGFAGVQALRNVIDIEDYALQQTSLDDVFIRFARRQFDADAGRRIHRLSLASLTHRRRHTNTMHNAAEDDDMIPVCKTDTP
jgi:hypothetical protein